MQKKNNKNYKEIAKNWLSMAIVTIQQIKVKISELNIKERIKNWNLKEKLVLLKTDPKKFATQYMKEICVGVVIASVLIGIILVSIVGNSKNDEPPATPTPPVVSATPTPEIEVTPTPAPTSFTTDAGTFDIVDEVVRVTMDSYIRKSTSTSAERLVGVNSGTQLQRIGIGANNWSVVVYNDTQGYMPTYYLESVDTTEYGNMHEIMSAIERVNVRAKASMDGAVLGTLDMGEEVVATGVGDNGWTRVQYNGNTAYVCSEYLVKVGADPSKTTGVANLDENIYTVVNQVVQAKSNVNVRKGPSTDSEIIGNLLGGHSITRIAVGNNGWSKVEFNGGIGYVNSDYLVGLTY